MARTWSTIFTTALLASLTAGGCVSEQTYRANAGEALCQWAYSCEDQDVLGPLEASYLFRTVESCTAWFAAVGHYAFDGDRVVADVEEDEACYADVEAGNELIREIEGRSCEELSVSRWVEQAEEVFNSAYVECPSHGS